MSVALNEVRSYPAKPGDVYLFGTCVLDLFDPDAGVSAASLLENSNISVHYPQDQTCCGQPAYTSGFPDAARQVAARQLHLFAENWPIVVPSGSCAGMMRHHWPRLFEDDPALGPLAASIAARVFELTEFLLHVVKATWPQTGANERVVLHTSCTARREMGTHLSARALLAQIPNVELVLQDHETECCGFGGAFSVKHPEISAAMASDKIEAIEATGAATMISADGGCLLNLNGTLEKRGSTLRGQHIASYLWQHAKDAA
ncbi:MAG: (Fe-S)-binding protein [Sulfuritalea sp.]|nr:(Fe-S)-binding protein [Sulfuritalea sp.]